MRSDRPRDPWGSFLRELDAQLTVPTELHCLGGFVVAEHYGLLRTTGDIDVLESRGTDPATLVGLGGRGSALHKKYGVYIDFVTVANVPDDYESRLIDVFDGQFKHLRLRVFEQHDLALAKLVRNADRDRQDVEALARGPGLDVNALRSRYQQELRPLLSRPEREDLTIDLWADIIDEINQPKGS